MEVPRWNLHSQRAFLFTRQQQEPGPAFLEKVGNLTHTVAHNTNLILITQSTNVHFVSAACWVDVKLYTVRGAKLSKK